MMFRIKSITSVSLINPNQGGFRKGHSHAAKVRITYPGNQ
jgi:hypothetical protein